MVCKLCASLFQIEYHLWYSIVDLDWVYTRKARQLKLNQTNCWMCKYLYDWLPGTDEHDNDTYPLWHRLLHPGTDGFKDTIEYGARMTETRHPGHYRLQLMYYLRTERPLPPEYPGTKTFIFIPYLGTATDSSILNYRHVLTFVNIEANRYIPTKALGDTTGGDQALDLTSKWLVKCRSEHTLCNAYQRFIKQQDPQFRPTRLIEILPDAIRLHETVDTEYLYVALSHRWPSKATLLTLTTDNYHDFLRFIPEHNADLGCSKVFADAIKVCRHLKINYIWIDSLCIVQRGDNYVDWRRESTRMGDVYKYALCTISATSIEDENQALQEGMFRTREVRHLEPTIAECSFDKSTPAYGSPTIRLKTMVWKKDVPKRGEYLFLPEDSWHASLTSAPIYKRGWVAQERHLSSRTVYFTRDQVWFDCYETMAR